VGQTHAEALSTLPESQLVAVCDASAERARQFAARYGGRAFTDLSKFLKESGAQALTIATPHPAHADPAIRAAEAGVHVLVEKPLAASLSDCDDMIAAAQKAGVTLSVISQRRFYEPVIRMKAAIDTGKIGEPILGSFNMFSWRDRSYYLSDPWRGKWLTEGGGVLVNQSAHHLDLLQWLMGPVQEVSGYWANLNHPEIEVDDTAVAVLRFRGGALGSIVTSVSQKPGIHTKIHVHGSNGASVGVETDRGATFIAGMSGVVEPPLNDLWTIPGEEHLLAEFQAADRSFFARIDPTKHYHALQIQHFLTSILRDRPPLVTAEEGRAVVALFTAIYRSQRLGRPIKFPLEAETDDEHAD
jgi:predicted dehydrogenase